MNNLLFTAIVTSILVALGRGKVGYTLTAFGSILGVGLLVGVLMGNVTEALLLSTEIQAIYLGFTQSGGVIASDSIIATAITVPLCLATGLDRDAALALAIPVGTVAANLTTLIYIINGQFYRNALACADKGDEKGIARNAEIYPVVVRALIYGATIFVGIYFGSSLLEKLLSVTPDWLVNGLSVAGGVLPIIGFALVLKSMRRTDYIPFFIIGFFVIAYFAPQTRGGYGISTMGVAIFTVCFAVVKFFLNGDVDLSAFKATGEEKKDRIFTKKDVNRLYWRWWWFLEAAHNYEGMQALGMANAMIPALKKLYGNDKEKFSNALRRHLAYFNTNGIYGATIPGIVLAMEEEQAINQEMDEETFEVTVNGIKTGLMGPMAGVGDTIEWGIWNKVFIGMGMSLTAQGNWIGAIIPWGALLIISTIEGLTFINLGYKLGADSVSALFSGGLAKKITDCASFIGMTMMGALAAQHCSFAFANETMQSIANAFAPKVMVLLLVFFIYWLLTKKNAKISHVTFGVIAVAIVLSLLHIV